MNNVSELRAAVEAARKTHEAALAASQAAATLASQADAKLRQALHYQRRALAPIDASLALTVAFQALRKQGFIARKRFWCCQGCGLSALGASPYNLKEDGSFVFFHKQDAERLAKNNSTYLSWGGDGAKIVAACKAAGLRVSWNGTDAERIYVTGNKFERGDVVRVCGSVGKIERASRDDDTAFMVRFHEDKAPERIGAECLELIDPVNAKEAA